MPTTQTTRRAVLAGAIALPMMGTPAAIAAGRDPVIVLIEEHGRAAARTTPVRTQAEEAFFGELYR
jgi:hypothetical protein